MNLRSTIVALVAPVALIAVASRALALDLYVSPQGNDAWSGRLAAPDGAGTDGPFATLTRARDEVRRLGAPGERVEPVTIHLRGGVHALPAGMKLEAQDGGSARAPVVWRAYRDEKPIVIGGRTVTGFVPHKGDILKADLAAQGLKGVAFTQLLFGGARQHLARYPNFDPKNPYGGGWAYADGAYVPMYKEVPGEDRRSFTLKARDARPWARPAEAEVFVFPRYNWWNNICRIESIDPATRKVRLAQDASYPIRPGDRFYVRNVFEELDAPGEWYLDRATSTLYFWPPSPLEGKPVLVPTTRTILDVSNAAHLTFRGLTIECSEGTAIAFKDASDCLVAGCTIRNVGDYRGGGASVSDGRRVGIVGCDIHDVGSTAISLAGGDRATLTPAGHFADNNYIHHTGIFYKQGVGISLTGVGNRATHNLIHDCPRFGIGFSGNNLLIEFNHIRHVNLETADTGAVYTGGRDWISSRGTVIRHNFFHDVLGYGFEDGKWVSPHYAWGVYLDDNAGGVDVVGNVVARCVRGLVHLHNGRDNRVENNVFVEGRLQQMECNGWTDKHSYWTSHLPSMIKGYELVKDQPAWREMRGMQTHPTKAVLPDGQIMSGNTFLRNIVYYTHPQAKYVSFRTFPHAHNRVDLNLIWPGGEGRPVRTGVKPGGGAKDEWEAWRALGMDVNSVIADPQFVDPAKDDYRLKPTSPALKLGFEPIPFEKIGPYRSELRASWPIVEAEGAREKPLVSQEH